MNTAEAIPGTPRRALVTGANRGIGLAVCFELHKRGYEVIAGTRSVGRAAELDGVATTVELDVTDPLSVSRAAVTVGDVDVLVPNAGVLLDRGAPPSTVDLDVVRETWEVNVLGAWRVCQAFVPGMAQRGWGRVVLVGSGTGCFANGLAPALPAYSMSKASLHALTVLLAGEFGPAGVLVNAVNPGTIRTDMMPRGEGSPADAAADIADAVGVAPTGPSGRLLRGGVPAPW